MQNVTEFLRYAQDDVNCYYAIILFRATGDLTHRYPEN
jgi:hypothetical protein